MSDTGIAQFFFIFMQFSGENLISSLKSLQNTGLCKESIDVSYKSLVDPGFPRGGANPRGLLNWHNFSRKLLENEKKMD